MTLTDQTVVADEEPTVSKPARRWWVRSRGWLLAFLALVVAALILTLLTLPKPVSKEPLNPTNPSRTGAQALARVLTDHGVTVDPIYRVRDTKQLTHRSTLLVVNADDLSGPALSALRETSADLVLVAPGGRALEQLAPDLRRIAKPTSARHVAARCADPLARRAGTISGGGTAYRAAGPGRRVVTCFGGQYATSYGPRGQRVTVIGSPAVLGNETIRDHGNAALAVGALGQTRRLTWLMANSYDLGDDEESSPRSLMPRWFRPGALLLFLASLLLMVARGRRLGRLVLEPLPVTVHAAETVRGRATLYRRSGAYDRTLAILRARSLQQATRRLGLPPHTPAPAIITAWAAATGEDETQLTRILTEPVPGLGAADLLQRVEELDAHTHHLTALTGGHPLKGTQ